MIVTFKGVEVEIQEVTAGKATAAEFLDTGEQLDRAELEQLTDYYPDALADFEIIRAALSYDDIDELLGDEAV